MLASTQRGMNDIYGNPDVALMCETESAGNDVAGGSGENYTDTTGPLLLYSSTAVQPR